MEKIIFNLQTALQRFEWRLTNGTFTPNQNDLEAFKVLAQWIIDQKKQALNHHYAFQKLYAMHLYHKMLHTHDVKEANKQIVQELKISASQHYNRLLNHLNQIELDKLMKSLEIQPKIQYKQELKATYITEAQKQKNKKIMEQNKELLNQYLNGIWDEHDFYDRLDNQITEALNRFNTIENGE